MYFHRKKFETYFDYPLSLVTLENTYNFSPKINNKHLSGDNILGISSHIWTETIDNNIDLEKRIFPRLIAFSENAWSNELIYDDFLLRLEIYLKKLDERNIYYSNYDNNNVDEIVSFFKTFLNSNIDSISLYQTLVGSKLILNLLKKSYHIKDIPQISYKILKK